MVIGWYVQQEQDHGSEVSRRERLAHSGKSHSTSGFQLQDMGQHIVTRLKRARQRETQRCAMIVT